MSRNQSSGIVGQAQDISKIAQGNSAADQTLGASGGNAALSGFLAQQANPGYTPGEQDAVTGATEGGLGAAFGSAAEQGANTAARTNNSAGLTSNLDALARQRMITSGNIGAQNQENFANARIAGTEQANQGLAGLFGTGTNAGNSALNTANSALGTANSASAANPSFWDQFGGSLAKSLGNIKGSVTQSIPGGSVTGGYG